MPQAWKPGRETIADLIERRHLERISGDAANGTYPKQLCSARHGAETLVCATNSCSKGCLGRRQGPYWGVR